MKQLLGVLNTELGLDLRKETGLGSPLCFQLIHSRSHVPLQESDGAGVHPLWPLGTSFGWSTSSLLPKTPGPPDSAS